MNEREAVEPRTAKLLTPTAIRVLVVEDDSALQEAIVDTLELAGCAVVAASSAERALELLEQTVVDIDKTVVPAKMIP